MHILITAATQFELEKLEAQLPIFKNFSTDFLTTGVGSLLSTVAFMEAISTHPPDFILQMGIAGSFNLKKYPSQKIVLVAQEILGDCGVWEKNNWKDIFDLGLADKNKLPFQDKMITNQNCKKYNFLNLNTAKSITVNTISTKSNLIKKIHQYYHPDIETMEGIALHYVCEKFSIPYLQFRGISNKVGTRDKTQWKIASTLEYLQKNVQLWLEKYNQFLDEKN